MWKCGACEAMMWKWRMRKSRVRVFCAHARIVHDYTVASCRLLTAYAGSYTHTHEPRALDRTTPTPSLDVLDTTSAEGTGHELQRAKEDPLGRGRQLRE